MNTVDLEKIRARRKEMRISQQEMAELLGFKNASTYCKYEKGLYKFDANHIPIVAEKLKFKVKDIFFDKTIAKIAI
ncbi:helix-turn-helix transcriptional regulator [Gorillibacterium sp. CAU 1737]|uniref:helix-turn-helix transcriptional regulator n=1 Tax=Gorillibacterium sp. CAU 1737 TaxID=3140362 RepID=UPI003260A55B